MQPDLLELVQTAKSLYERGYSFGTAGNLSVRIGDIIYATPTGSSFGQLTVEGLAACDLSGKPTGPNKPTKELPFHLAAYRARPDARAVVHLHSTYATAVASMRDLDMQNALPPLTAYYAMRVPSLPVVSYLPPGDTGLAVEVEKYAKTTPAMLMRNHGSIAIGTTLLEATALAEEIEETARLHLLLGERAHPLNDAEIATLRARFAR
ncbi:MAG: class II aldolase/adducin family protein [Acidobacteria bacterium]|nr:class II aldolase/adducin family protein [Acidobacteriota bacterium]